MDIEWDPDKAKSNLTKHGVSFPDAESVLFDPYALTVADDREVSEDRHVTTCYYWSGCVGADPRGSIRSLRRNHKDNFGETSDSGRKEDL